MCVCLCLFVCVCVCVIIMWSDGMVHTCVGVLTFSTLCRLCFVHSFGIELEETDSNSPVDLGLADREGSVETNVDEPGYDNNSDEALRQQQGVGNSYPSVGDDTVSPLATDSTVTENHDKDRSAYYEHRDYLVSNISDVVVVCSTPPESSALKRSQVSSCFT